ncbi:hypothetical protein KI387_027290, partial [Taxus chinensis]
STFLPRLIYSLLGCSRNLTTQPVSIAFVFLDAIPREEVSPINDSILHFKLGFTATLFTGLFHACLNVL